MRVTTINQYDNRSLWKGSYYNFISIGMMEDSIYIIILGLGVQIIK